MLIMIRLRQVRVPIDNEIDLKKKVSKLLKTKESNIKNIKCIKKSIDARDKNNILYVYELDVEVLSEDIILKKINSKDIFKSINKNYSFPKINNKDKKIVIVGSGPAGLFCGYVLAEAGEGDLVITMGAGDIYRVGDIIREKDK